MSLFIVQYDSSHQSSNTCCVAFRYDGTSHKPAFLPSIQCVFLWRGNSKRPSEPTKNMRRIAATHSNFWERKIKTHEIAGVLSNDTSTIQDLVVIGHRSISILAHYQTTIIQHNTSQQNAVAPTKILVTQNDSSYGHQ
jgi:hypothetical protein